MAPNKRRKDFDSSAEDLRFRYVYQLLCKRGGLELGNYTHKGSMKRIVELVERHSKEGTTPKERDEVVRRLKQLVDFLEHDMACFLSDDIFEQEFGKEFGQSGPSESST